MVKRKIDEADILLETIIKGIQEMKGENITVLHLEKIETAVCKYFIICTGNSNIHVSSISDNIRKFVSKEIKENPWSIEGKPICEWVLLDYLNIVVHVFQEKIRNFYKLEDLWGDSEIKNINKLSIK